METHIAQFRLYKNKAKEKKTFNLIKVENVAITWPLVKGESDGTITAAPMTGAVAQPPTWLRLLSGTSDSEDSGHHSDILAAAPVSPLISHLPLWINKFS